MCPNVDSRGLFDISSRGIRWTSLQVQHFVGMIVSCPLRSQRNEGVCFQEGCVNRQEYVCVAQNRLRSGQMQRMHWTFSVFAYLEDEAFSAAQEVASIDL